VQTAGFTELFEQLESQFDLPDVCEAPDCVNEAEWIGACESCGFAKWFCDPCKVHEEELFEAVDLIGDPRCVRCAAQIVLLWERIWKA
jgi:hypothetical protein